MRERHACAYRMSLLDTPSVTFCFSGRRMLPFPRNRHITQVRSSYWIPLLPTRTTFREIHKQCLWNSLEFHHASPLKMSMQRCIHVPVVNMWGMYHVRRHTNTSHTPVEKSFEPVLKKQTLGRESKQ